jgi:hypothetical protein
MGSVFLKDVQQDDTSVSLSAVTWQTVVRKLKYEVDSWVSERVVVCVYVCTRVGQRLALAPRPLMIYCASPFN